MKSYITLAYDTHDLDRASASTLSLPRMCFISGLEPCRNKLHRIRYGYYMDRIIELVKQTLEVAAATPCHQERTPDALPFGHATPSSVLGLPPRVIHPTLGYQAQSVCLYPSPALECDVSSSLVRLHGVLHQKNQTHH